MSHELAPSIAEFQKGDITVRIVGGFFGILPFVASWSPTTSLDAAALAAATRLNAPELAGRIRARAEQLARAEGPQAALAAFEFLDKGDKGIALFSGLRTAYKTVRGQEGALEMDPQQAADAGLKAIGISWATWKLFPGSAAEKVRALTSTEAGRALLAWYTAADLVLPFADNLASGGTAAITTMISGQASENAKRLAAVAGGEVEQATGMLSSLMGTFESGLGQAAAYAEPLSAYVQTQVPSIFGTADKVTGVVATGVDALASYRLIGASLVAEVCLNEAAKQVKAEAEAEALEAARLAAEKAAREKADAEAKAAKDKADAEGAAAAKAAYEAGEKAAAEARLKASAVRDDYSLNATVAADSLKNNPIKFTKSAEIEARTAAPPAKRGCMGCMGVLLVGIAGAGALVAASGYLLTS
jgi:hypothetical protein